MTAKVYLMKSSVAALCSSKHITASMKQNKPEILEKLERVDEDTTGEWVDNVQAMATEHGLGVARNSAKANKSRNDYGDCNWGSAV